MTGISLEQAVWLLAAAAIAAPLAKALRIGSVLGYLLAGVLMGPFGFGKIFSSPDHASGPITGGVSVAAHGGDRPG